MSAFKISVSVRDTSKSYAVAPEQEKPEPATLQSLHRELQALRQRIDDLEDLHDLDEAVRQNAGQPLIPWEQAKKDLVLE